MLAPRKLSDTQMAGPATELVSPRGGRTSQVFKKPDVPTISTSAATLQVAPLNPFAPPTPNASSAVSATAQGVAALNRLAQIVPSTPEVQQLLSSIRSSLGAARTPRNSLPAQPAPTPRRPSLSFSMGKDNQSLSGTVDESALRGAHSLRTTISGALYLALEGLLHRLRADRLTLFLHDPVNRDLQAVMSCGAGMARPRRGTYAAPSGLVHSVFATGIAANLHRVFSDDIGDCLGPTQAKNAIIFPLRSPFGNNDVLGVVFVVNKLKGTVEFDGNDEAVLYTSLPNVAYIAERYPVDYFAPSAFDPAVLQRCSCLLDIPAASAPLPLPTQVPVPRLVFHRHGREKNIKRAMEDKSLAMKVEDTIAEQLKSVEQYVTALEKCWKASMIDGMALEQQLKQKTVHIAEARELLKRKQHKMDLLKDALCEQVEETMQAMGGARLATSQYPST